MRPWKEMGKVEISEVVEFVAGGGPVMSVVEILTGAVTDTGKGTGNILCKWWDEKETKYKEYYFNASELKPYMPTPAAKLSRPGV